VTTPLTVVYGEAIDGQAQVMAVDGSAVTGTVTFYDGVAGFCVLGLMDGASCPEGSETGFGAGTHVFTAMYSGDATHTGATSNAVTVNVTRDTTTTALVSSANPVPAGEGVVYTATVAGAHGPVAGAVTFFDGTMTIGSGALDGGGRAVLSVVMVTPGGHTITAVYGGSANSAESTSPALGQVVKTALAASSTTLTVSANPAATGQSVAFTATVSAAGGKVATGTVAFGEGGAVLGSAIVGAGGAAVWTTALLSQGSHSIVARYSGDGETAASVSPMLNEVVEDAAASNTFTISVDKITVAAGDIAVVPVKVTGGLGLAKAVSLSCGGLPSEATCSSAAGSDVSAGATTLMLKISTMAPRDCGSSVPYGGLQSAGLPVMGPVLAGLLLFYAPKRRRVLKGLLAVLCAVMTMGAITGCGTGNCTDLGTRPGTYTITVTGSAGGAMMSQKVKLVVTP
jgi:hypothetical protein